VLTVTQLTQSVKSLLETSFGKIAVSGEISNFVKHTSGHLYFTLKDDGAQLSCVMFRGSAQGMFFLPKNGQRVVCRGSVTVYEPRGNYQLVVSMMRPDGEGALQAAFEKLKQKLSAEGLFDHDRKRQLPSSPSTIAYVTSRTGAVLRDLESVVRRRNPGVNRLLIPVQVQGVGAAESIVEGIRIANDHGGADVIILARGGGSIEDLWPFNEEIVARAIVASRIPIVSAVGHETDVTIADFAADVRAATPSVAAELVVPFRGDALSVLRGISNTLWKFVDSKRTSSLRQLEYVVNRREFSRVEHAIQMTSQLLDDRASALNRLSAAAVDKCMHMMSIAREQLERHNPEAISSKGYAIVRSNGRIVQSAHELAAGDTVEMSFRADIAKALVTESPIAKEKHFDGKN
jgi:exodeoxyribonuclease VII large subunit